MRSLNEKSIIPTLMSTNEVVQTLIERAAYFFSCIFHKQKTVSS